MSTFSTASGFQFAGVGVNTVATKTNKAILPVLVLDASGSIGNAGAEALVQSLLTRSIEEMRAKGVHEGAYLGAWYFNSRHADFMLPVVPFTGIDNVDVSKIPTLVADGTTPMFGALDRALEAANLYATKLDEEGVTTDIFLTLVTDGYPEGHDDRVVEDVRKRLQSIRTSKAEVRPASIFVAVIGVGDDSGKSRQQAFTDQIGADLYIYAGDLNGKTIGKVVGWFSSSVHLSQQTGASKAADFTT